MTSLYKGRIWGTPWFDNQNVGRFGNSEVWRNEGLGDWVREGTASEPGDPGGEAWGNRMRSWVLSWKVLGG